MLAAAFKMNKKLKDGRLLVDYNYKYIVLLFIGSASFNYDFIFLNKNVCAFIRKVISES